MGADHNRVCPDIGTPPQERQVRPVGAIHEKLPAMVVDNPANLPNI